MKYHLNIKGHVETVWQEERVDRQTARLRGKLIDRITNKQIEREEVRLTILDLEGEGESQKEV